MGKPDICQCENKDADQLQDSSFFSVTIQAGLCLSWSDTPKTGFIMSGLICVIIK